MLTETVTDIRKERHHITQEDFTPEIVLEMFASGFFKEEFQDADSVFLDNSCGNGNILLFVLGKKLDAGIGYLDALETLFGIDLMKDNVEECHERIRQLLEDRRIEFDRTEVDRILEHNIVCHDSLDWNFKEWKPNPKIIEEPLF